MHEGEVAILLEKYNAIKRNKARHEDNTEFCVSPFTAYASTFIGAIGLASAATFAISVAMDNNPNNPINKAYLLTSHAPQNHVSAVETHPSRPANSVYNQNTIKQINTLRN